MKNIVRVLVLLLVFTSCKNTSKNTIEITGENLSYTKDSISQPAFNETQIIVQKILDLPELQWVYHQELKERLPVKVLESKLIDKRLILHKFGQTVSILSMSELEKEGIKDYVVFNKIEISKDIAYFALNYKIEGAGCSGKLIKENGEWSFSNYSVWER